MFKRMRTDGSEFGEGLSKDEVLKVVDGRAVVDGTAAERKAAKRDAVARERDRLLIEVAHVLVLFAEDAKMASTAAHLRVKLTEFQDARTKADRAGVYP